MKKLVTALLLSVPLLLGVAPAERRPSAEFPTSFRNEASPCLSSVCWNGIDYTQDSRFFWCSLFRSSGATALADDCTEDGTANNITTKVGTPVAQQSEVPSGFSAASRSAVFDGVSDLWKVADAADGPFDVTTLEGGTGFTAGCYAMIDSGGAGAGWMLNKNDDATIQWGIIQVGIGSHRFYTDGAQSATNPATVADGVWYHHVGRFTVSGSVAETTLDGAAMTPVARTTAAGVEDEFGVGSNTNESQEWKGNLTECWISDTLITDQEICRICRCGLTGDIAIDRKTSCNSCTMSTNTCNTGG